MKKFNTKDGMSIELLRQNNIIPVIITKEDSKIVYKRAEKLKVKEVYIGVTDKLKIIEHLISKYNIEYGNIAYIGDDINDLPVLQKVGMSFSPSDAENPIKQIVDYVVHKKGGKGAFREAVEIAIARESNEFINNS